VETKTEVMEKKKGEENKKIINFLEDIYQQMDG